MKMLVVKENRRKNYKKMDSKLESAKFTLHKK